MTKRWNICVVKDYKFINKRAMRSWQEGGGGPHLSDSLIGAFDQDLLGPPIILCHGIKEPLTSSRAGIELFGQELNPLQHGRLKSRYESTIDRPIHKGCS